MLSKQIVFAEAKKTEIWEHEVLPPSPGQVQVRLAVSSISSGTERANLVGEVNISVKEHSDTAHFPRYVGYSSAGVVEAVGEEVEKLKVGDRVALCWSKYSQVINISEDLAFKLGDNVSFEDAALFHIASFPLAAIRKCRLEIGESAIVMGMGILGLLSIPLLRNAGAVPVIAVDPIEAKRKKALACGADYALDPYASDFAETVKKLTDGGANVAIEVTGVGQALDGVLDCMAKMGRVALLGCTRNSDFTIDYYHKVHGPGISLIGAHTMARPEKDSSNGFWTQQDDMNTLIRLHENGRVCFGKMVDEIHTFQKAPEIFRRLIEESAFPLVQFSWRYSDETN